MTYHKIRGIPLTECTAEQKIAYNIAFNYYNLFIKEYKSLPAAFLKSELIHQAVNKMISFYKSGNHDFKYDIDSIYCALNAGFENYLNAEHKILYDYKSIGEMFPALYLK